MDDKTAVVILGGFMTAISIAIIIKDGITAITFATSVVGAMGTLAGYIYGRNGRGTREAKKA